MFSVSTVVCPYKTSAGHELKTEKNQTHMQAIFDIRNVSCLPRGTQIFLYLSAAIKTNVDADDKDI
ncbi:hypothetical protein CHS0354_008046, partial [Potamilus streckersoni]